MRDYPVPRPHPPGGVYAGQATHVPLVDMFDKQIQLREGQCNVRSWTKELLPFVEAAVDPLGLNDLVTHAVPLSRGPELCETFQQKQDGCVKVVREL